MHNLRLGQIVSSKAGRDKGRYYIIVELAKEYVLLVDGDFRRLEKPKKKNLKHIMPTNYHSNLIVDAQGEIKKVTNIDIKKELASLTKQFGR